MEEEAAEAAEAAEACEAAELGQWQPHRMAQGQFLGQERVAQTHAVMVPVERLAGVAVPAETAATAVAHVDPWHP